MSTAALLLAAGAGTRLGGSLAKAFVALGDRPMLQRSMEAIEACGVVDRTVLVVPPDEVERARRLAAGPSETGRIQDVIAGGETRQTSVRCGLAALPEGIEVVLCHDAARPFASPALFVRVVEAIRSGEGEAAVPVVRSPDTVKRIEGSLVVHTIPRDEIGLVQTPQAFRADILRRAHDEALRTGLSATDDAMLVEAIGSRVVVVEGEEANFKITTLEDLRRAEALIKAGRGGTDRD
jgi:2-C-methyl-D-erythritol 4-phosphate cytidylyltransferase